ncbi:MAG TPA: hypothetical protein VJV03_17595, partial [Pyrinomonadaceae bacterium]|nr:hypothetical protein [Pyrinomonadaceae bacterium]
MTKFASLTTLAIAVFALPGLVAGQTTTTGSRDASITRSTQAQPRPSPTPVSPVRPLTEEERQRQAASTARRQQEAATGDPDVLLDVPNLSVDEITLDVENLKAKVSLDARLANLLALT